MVDQNKQEVVTQGEITLETIHQLLGQMGRDFESKLKYDAHKEQVIDRLHRELLEYRQDLYKKMLQPVILDLITLTDQVEKQNMFAKSETLPTIEQLLKQAEYFGEDLQDLLYRNGVETYRVEGDHFNPKKQKIVTTKETDQIELKGRIVQRLHPGYEWDGKIVRPEKVVAYRYVKAIKPIETPEIVVSTECTEDEDLNKDVGNEAVNKTIEEQKV